MKLLEVNSRSELKEFVQFPLKLYSKCPQFVPIIIKQEVKSLGKNMNPDFSSCETRLWMVKHENRIVGRIAGIINRDENQKNNIARFGWLDFEENPEIAKLLLDTAEEWSIKYGAQSIHGPLGFTSFDKCGILVEGFEEIPTIFSNYNYPYYGTIIEQMGYEKQFDWIEYNILVPKEVPEKIQKGADIVQTRYGIKSLPFSKISEVVKHEKTLFNILLEAYSGLDGFTNLTFEQFDSLFQQFSPLIIPEFTSVIMDKDAQIIGFGLAIPSFSKALIKIKGKITPFDLVHFYNAKKHNDTADLLLIAVKPEYQKKGAHALIFNKIMKAFQMKGIKYVESNKELQVNYKIQNLWHDYDYKQHKRSRCYIKEL